MAANRLQELYREYTSTQPRSERVAAEFCRAASELFESEGLQTATSETRIRRLLEHCEQRVGAELVAEAVGCSVSYARRFSYESGRGAFQRDWSKAAQREKVSPGTRTRIINRDGGACLRCGREEPAELEVHHILPVSQGGTNEDSNLATLCSRCHRAAHGGSKTSGEIAYPVADFREWTRRTEWSPDQQRSPLGPGQRKITDY